MSVYKVTKKEKAPVAKGTGFWIDGFGHVAIEWTEPESFDPDYDKVMIIKAFIRSAERLFDAIDISYDHSNRRE